MRLFKVVLISYLFVNLVYGFPPSCRHQLALQPQRIIFLTQLAAYTNNHMLDLSHSNLSDSDVPTVVTYLKSHPDITGLNLEDDDLLTPPSFIAVGGLNTLHDLNIGKTVYTGAHSLQPGDLTVFVNNSSLEVLDLSHHKISDAGAIALSKNQHLKKLKLYDYDLTDIGAIALINHSQLNELVMTFGTVTAATAQALAHNKLLTKVTFYFEDPDSVAPILAKNTTLTDLTLYGYTEDYGLTDAGALALSKNTHLQALKIIGMAMTANGVGSIATMSNLTKLAIESCDCGESAKQVDDAGAEALAQNKSIRELSLKYSICTSKGMPALGKMSQLRSLNLEGSEELDDAAAVAIALNLKNLEDLNVSDNLIGDRGATALAKMTNLHTLNLAITRIGQVGALALSRDSTLSSLNLRHTRITDEGALAFANVETLSELDVSDDHLSNFTKIALQNNPYFKKLIV